MELVDKLCGSATIKEGTVFIGNEAFKASSSLATVTIPNSVTNIGNSAFEGCSNMRSIHSNNPTPPMVGRDAFKGIKTIHCVIYVPTGAKEDYAFANGWSDFYNIVEEVEKATDDANKFKADHATILGETTSTVTSSDLEAINNALEDYENLSDAAKAKLSAEKALLDALKKKAEELANDITSINPDKANEIFYNMKGQRINRDAKGLIIKNGKKVMVK